MAFRGTGELRSRLGKSFERMLKFYGFEMKVHGGTRSLIAEAKEDGGTGDETDNMSEERENIEASGEFDTITPHAANKPHTGGHLDPNGEHKKATSLNPHVSVVVRPMETSVFRKAAGNWWCGFNHNHLRITRIIRCLRILGLESEAQAFYQALVETKEIYSGGPSETTYMFWRRAAKRPLEISPENEDWDDSI